MGKKINLDSLPATKGDLKKIDFKFEKRFDKVMNLLTGLAKMIKDLYEEFAAFNLEHKRAKIRIENHEQRITNLEERAVN